MKRLLQTTLLSAALIALVLPTDILAGGHGGSSRSHSSRSRSSYGSRSHSSGYRGSRQTTSRSSHNRQPSTRKPVTRHPVTRHPVTKRPVTKRPVTKHPITKSPITRHPITKRPPFVKHPSVKHHSGVGRPPYHRPQYNQHQRPHHWPIVIGVPNFNTCPPVVIREQVIVETVVVEVPVATPATQPAARPPAQPVAPSAVVQQDPQVQLPEVPVGATITMAGENLGSDKGQLLLSVSGLSLAGAVVDWKNDKATVTLPAIGLARPTEAQLHLLRADGQIAQSVAIRLLPAVAPAAATIGQSQPTDGPQQQTPVSDDSQLAGK